MRKKGYQHPNVTLLGVIVENLLTVGSVKGNANLKMGSGGSSQAARGREYEWED